MRKSRLSQYKQNKLIELFVAGTTALTAAELVSVSKIPQPVTSPFTSAYLSKQSTLENVRHTRTATLLPIIREQIKPDSIVYKDYYRNYGRIGCQ